MKNTIEGFSQRYATTLRKKVIKRGKETEIKIDCTDLVILRWFVDFYPNMRKMIIDGREYAWLTHNKIMEDLPLIDISKDSFIDRMQKLVEFNILKYQFIKDGGSFSLYSFGENYYNLIDDGDGGKCSSTYGVSAQAPTGVSVQAPIKDKSIINKSIKDNKENIIKEIVDYLNEKMGTKYRASTKSTASCINARLKEGYKVEDFKTVIDKKYKEWKGTEMEKYLTPDTLFRPSHFEKYLNQNIIAKNSNSNLITHSYTNSQISNIYDSLDDVEI